MLYEYMIHGKKGKERKKEKIYKECIQHFSLLNAKEKFILDKYFSCPSICNRFISHTSCVMCVECMGYGILEESFSLCYTLSLHDMT